MKKVVVTGAQGFLGKNLSAHLEQAEGVEFVRLGRQDNLAFRSKALASADIVFHLAGVNRSHDDKDFHEGNLELTRHYLDLAAAAGRKPTFVMASSVQAAIDNPYGRSKLAAELEVRKFHRRRKITGRILRLPGVFGKWSKAGYNSVVATFCFNVANGKPITINERAKVIPLLYIDDLVKIFLELINENQDRLIRPKLFPIHRVKIGELADLIKSFAESREGLVVPNMANEFVKAVYSTYLSFLPEKKIPYKLEVKSDRRGSLFEWIKSPFFGQIFVSKTKPGVTRGEHYHHTKTEKFLVISGQASVQLRQIHGDRVIDYQVNGDNPLVVDIPCGFTHKITNIGKDEVVTLFWANEIFDSSNPDTYFLKV